MAASYVPRSDGSAPAPAGTQQAAAPPVAATGRLLPTAADVSRAITPESTHAVYQIVTTGAIEECFAHLKIKTGLVYISAGEINGVLQPAAGDCNIGRVRKFLTEIRVVGDENIPYLINETSKSDPQSARIYVRGTAGTKVLLVYVPA